MIEAPDEGVDGVAQHAGLYTVWDVVAQVGE